MPNEVFVLIDPDEQRTFAEVSPDGVTAVTLAFPTRKAAHSYRNDWGLPQRLTPQAFAPDHLDRAAAKSMEWFGEPATWRLVTDRTQAPNISADRVDPLTGEVEIVRWGMYYNLDWIMRSVLAELTEEMAA